VRGEPGRQWWVGRTPYWETWTIHASTSLRTQQVQHPAPGDAAPMTSNYTSGAAAPAGGTLPDASASESVTSSTGTGDPGTTATRKCASLVRANPDVIPGCCCLRRRSRNSQAV
jgi:hypothetical protein